MTDKFIPKPSTLKPLLTLLNLATPTDRTVQDARRSFEKEVKELDPELINILDAD